MPRVENTFDGGTSGVVPSIANSGGASGDAFDDVTIGAGAAILYSNAQVLHGAISISIDPAASVVAYVGYEEDVMGAVTEVYGRGYFYFAALPAANQVLVVLRDGTTSTTRGWISITTTGTMRIVDASGTTQATSSVGISTGAWNRIEWYFKGDPTTGAATVRLFKSGDLEGTTPTSTVSASNINTGGSFNRYRIGNPGSAASNIGIFYVDNIGWDTATYLGPYVVEDKEVDLPLIDQTAVLYDPVVAVKFSRVNHFDVQPTGTTITSANSDPYSDDWEIVTIGAGSTLQYSTTQSYRGGASMSVNPGVSVLANTEWQTTAPTALGLIYGRCYVYLTAFPVALTVLVIARDSVTATDRARLTIQTDGRIRLVNAGGTNVGTTPNNSTGILALNAWNRIEWKMICDAASGQIEVKLFISDPAASSPDSTTTSAVTNTGGPVNRFRFGNLSAQASDIIEFFIDEIAIDAAGYPGPYTPFNRSIDIPLISNLATNTGSYGLTTVRRMVGLNLIDQTATLTAPAFQIASSVDQFAYLPTISTGGGGWGYDWGSNWGGRTYSMFDPAVRKIVQLALIDNSYTMYAPRVGPKTVTLPIITIVDAVFNPSMMWLTQLSLIDNTYTIYDPQVVDNSLPPPEIPLIDNTYTMYDPRVNPMYVELELLTYVNAVYNMSMMGMVQTPLLDNTYTMYQPQFILLPYQVGLPNLDNTYTIYDPAIKYHVNLEQIDNTYTIYDAEFLLAVEIDVELLLIDNEGQLFDLVSVDLGELPTVTLPLIDQSYIMRAPRFYAPLVRGIILRARYNPSATVKGRYTPSVTLRAREDL